MIIPVPTLSTQGFVYDQAGKIDYLLSHFFLSDYNQTYLYPGTVSSLPEIIQKNGGEVNGVIHDLTRKLKDYLGRYYDSIDLDIYSPNNNDADVSTKAELVISLSVVDGNKSTEFTRLLRTTNSKMSEIIRINNDGAAKKY